MAIILRNGEVSFWGVYTPQCGYISAPQCQIGTEVPDLALSNGIADFVLAKVLTSEFRKMIATCFLDPISALESEFEVPRTSK